VLNLRKETLCSIRGRHCAKFEEGDIDAKLENDRSILIKDQYDILWTNCRWVQRLVQRRFALTISKMEE